MVLLEFLKTFSGRHKTRESILQSISKKRDLVLQRLDAIDRIQKQLADLITMSESI